MIRTYRTKVANARMLFGDPNSSNSDSSVGGSSGYRRSGSSLSSSVSSTPSSLSSISRVSSTPSSLSSISRVSSMTYNSRPSNVSGYDADVESRSTRRSRVPIVVGSPYASANTSVSTGTISSLGSLNSSSITTPSSISTISNSDLDTL